jgi:hypothetical protein
MYEDKPNLTTNKIENKRFQCAGIIAGMFQGVGMHSNTLF